MSTKYNHMFDVAFSVVSEEKDYEKVPTRELLAAMRSRYIDLRRELLMGGDESIREAFGFSDSYEEDS